MGGLKTQESSVRDMDMDTDLGSSSSHILGERNATIENLKTKDNKEIYNNEIKEVDEDEFDDSIELIKEKQKKKE
eukprot:CAMPEP_0116924976 /NCGR_PEP_ID=MMETSP0467-20121206/23852_1 /TAXON_ID=283647 /ORGANISM="Mesodinium pulex, Strain SPMC105" /LENGTH=74 /DNA_ID=CAMNT_0004603949 /DNA_START=861 /DNA_END=1085 /DNA_ORIENTATION=+